MSCEVKSAVTPDVPMHSSADRCSSLRVDLYLDLLYFIKEKVELYLNSHMLLIAITRTSIFHNKSPSHVFSDI